MTWRIILEGSTDLPNWLCTEDDADEIGAEGLAELAIEDPQAIIEEMGGWWSVFRFERAPNSTSTLGEEEPHGG